MRASVQESILILLMRVICPPEVMPAIAAGEFSLISPT